MEVFDVETVIDIEYQAPKKSTGRFSGEIMIFADQCGPVTTTAAPTPAPTPGPTPEPTTGPTPEPTPAPTVTCGLSATAAGDRILDGQDADPNEYPFQVYLYLGKELFMNIHFKSIYFLVKELFMNIQFKSIYILVKELLF